MTALTLPTADVLGVEVAAATVEGAADTVIRRALSGDGGYAVMCNVHVLMTARKRPDVMHALNGAWAIFADGAPVAWLQRRSGRKEAQRVGGPDLMAAVLDRGRAHGLRHALFGSTPDVVRELSDRLQGRCPGIEIVHMHAPPTGAEDDPGPLSALSSHRPHVVWCALGAPKQELWMARHAHDVASSLVLGVGAAFDFHAGKKDRAPTWMRRNGLEWLHRLSSEPARLTGRYASTNLGFLVAVLRSPARQGRERRS